MLCFSYLVSQVFILNRLHVCGLFSPSYTQNERLAPELFTYIFKSHLMFLFVLRNCASCYLSNLIRMLKFSCFDLIPVKSSQVL